MSFRAMVVGLALGAGLASNAAAAPAEKDAVAGNARAGRDTYVKVGCHQCHGYSGQGAETTGSRLAPGLLPLPAFSHFLRNPRNVMPRYSREVLTDAEVADIHAYLAALPKPRSSRDIPILRDLAPAIAGGGK